ncbi:6,7-dimethyl-8-ribityllumazine synthase [hydrothermal vent metagenome]|uniref:6,7-dimethyl-8-ribityllumazine synthase n=1 Tax=hydrothermal vent metagenome TaxID=652676 RepID=A0A3B1E9I6_9ZZZZ
MNIIEGKLSLNGNEKVAIIGGRFNHIITDRLVEGAKDSFIRHGGTENNLDLILVPGAFEIPFALTKALQSGKYNAICCIGAIIRGATPHFDYISAEATKGIATATMQHSIPVSNGVLTTDTIEQAIERAGSKSGNKGSEAMTTIIEMLNLYKAMQ